MSVNAPVSARRAHTQEKLMEAAVAVFAERGIMGASVEQICEQAGFTRGAFYSNFESKDELCLALLHNYAEHLQQGMRAAVARIDLTDDAVDELIEQAVATFIRSQPRDPAWALTMAELRLYAVRQPSFRPVMKAFIDEVTPLFADMFVEALRAHGSRLILPVEDALRLLQAVYDQNLLADMADDNAEGHPGMQRELMALIRAMIVPTS